MGLFSINYNKPGPGVAKDAPVKKPFFRFWEVYFRKFFNLIKLNMLFAVPTAICFALCFLLESFVTGISSSLAFLGQLPLVLLSPFVGGLTFVCRNYAREEHAFILSDFMEATKKNWKQFLLNGIVCYVFYVLMAISINFYSSQMASNSILYIPFIVCILLSFLFICAQFYIPVMIVTFDLRLRQIYRNALIFSIIGLWRNLMLIAIIGVFAAAAFIFFLMMTPPCHPGPVCPRRILDVRLLWFPRQFRRVSDDCQVHHQSLRKGAAGEEEGCSRSDGRRGRGSD